MRTLTTLITIAICTSLSAQSLQEPLNNPLKKEPAQKEGKSLQGSLNERINNFEANINLSQDAVQLKWNKTANANIKSFIIEKSIDNLSWEEVATIYGASHKAQLTEYFHIDNTPNNNLSYYRLKSKTTNGKEIVSNTVPVNYLKKEGATAGMNLHPNFSEDYKIINIAFEEIFEKEILVVIRDIKGNEFYSKVIINAGDNALIAIPVKSEIPSGDYLITATSENQIYSQNITIP